MSVKRIQRYKDAANGDTRKAMALYRYNLRLSQEMFTIVSCFEVALRNAIDSLLVPSLGEDWLKDSVQDNGIFSNGRMNETRKIIEKAYNRLNRQGNYSHSKLIAEMEFGVWKYMYSSLQYRATGQCLLRAFLQKNIWSAYSVTSMRFFMKNTDRDAFLLFSGWLSGSFRCLCRGVWLLRLCHLGGVRFIHWLL